MARIRTIKPEITESESLSRCKREARLCFILLWTIADDAGRTRASSRMLASRLFPYDDDAIQAIPMWLSELEREGAIRTYTVSGDHYLDIPRWESHQKIDRPSPSKLPPYEDRDRDSRGTREDDPQPRAASSGDLDLYRDHGKEKDLLSEIGKTTSDEATTNSKSDPANRPASKPKRAPYPEDLEAFWTAYPTDPGMSKRDAAVQWAKLTEDDRRTALDTLPAFRQWIGKQGATYRVVHACRYLSGRRFDGFASARNGKGRPLDWQTFTHEDYENVCFLAEQREAWHPNYGPIENIPRDLLSANLKRIIGHVTQ